MAWPEELLAEDGSPAECRGVDRQHRPHPRDHAIDLKQLARRVEDLTATVPTGKGMQTYLRAILLVADHNAYHLGQLVAVRRALGLWK